MIYPNYSFQNESYSNSLSQNSNSPNGRLSQHTLSPNGLVSLERKIPTTTKHVHLVLLAILSAIAITGCGNQKPDTTKEEIPPLIEEINIGPVEVTITATPGSVMLDRDILLTIKTTAPRNTTVTIPPISDRLQGFIDSSNFDREPIITDTHITKERVIRLTPLISDEYRIAPMAIRYGQSLVVAPPQPHQPATNTTSSSATMQSLDAGNHQAPKWGATPPIVLPLHSITENSISDNISSKINNIWIRPSLRTVAGYIAITIIIAIIITVAIKLLSHIKRKVRLMRMSPRERALEELKELLSKKLIENHLLKDFYVELTMVVRRYIERQHHVRAPEQTTEEFLAVISSNTIFSPDVIKRLKEFLQAADLVKFAAYTPDRNSNNDAIETAKSYITTDAEEKFENLKI